MPEESQERQKNATPADNRPADAPEENQPRVDAPQRFVKRLLDYKLIAVLVVLTLLINVTALTLHSLGSADAICSAEHDLGVYRFLAAANEQGNIREAEFQLHIALLDDVQTEARRRLAEKKFRVQQDIEELLRRAHGGDFEDPSLGELKRRLQARINQTLGMKAIADVVVTNLQLDSVAAAAKPGEQISQSLPWIEKPSDYYWFRRN